MKTMVDREVLEAISKEIERCVRYDDPTLYFAAFVEVSWGVVYLSNGDRAEIQRLLPELADRLEGQLAAPETAAVGAGVSTAHADVRLAVERTCAGVGKTMTKAAKLALFVFKNNEDCPDGVGVNAFFSSLPGAPAMIRLWLARGKA